ncbi:hypothetical protein ACFLSZ_04335 [Candidatus Bipolaricaulota bacterium]
MSSKLAREAFNRSLSFLATEARPLERAQAVVHFRKASSECVWDELLAYQNDNGGFGHGLEPDVRTPSSSSLATAWALRVMRETGCSAEHPMVQGAVQFLIETYDPKKRVWRVVPEDANNYPHAPWWHNEDGSLSRTFNSYLIIPRALIVSHLHAYAELVPNRLLSEVTESAVEALEQVSVLGEGGGSDLEYAVELAQTPALPQAFRARLEARILRAIPDVIIRDADKWSTYCITPLRAVRTPAALGAHLIQDELSEHLDYVIRDQQPDGSWNPTWTWGEAYPDVWLQARSEWQGILTLENLTVLDAFGRIEPEPIKSTSDEAKFQV